MKSPRHKTTRPALLVLFFAALPFALEAASFNPGNLVVVTQDNGASALSSGATPLVLKEFAPTGANQTAIQSIGFDTTGANAMTDSGSASSQTSLHLSSDGSFLTAVGVHVDSGTASANNATSRIFAKIGLDGSVTYSNAYTVTSGENEREVIAASASSGYWIATSNGVKYASDLTTAPSTLTSTSRSIRGINIVQGQLYGTLSSSSSPSGVVTIGSGLPTSGNSNAVTSLPGFPTSNNSSPNDFKFFDLNNDNAPDTLYVSLGNTSGTGGVQRWNLSGSTWSLAYTFSGALNGFLNTSATGFYGLTGKIDGSNVDLFATTQATTNGANSLIAFTDSATLGNTTAPSGSALNFTTLATAGANQSFRGVDILAVPEPQTWAMMLAGLGALMCFQKLRRRKGIVTTLVAATLAAQGAHATPSLIAIGSLTQTKDKSTETNALENGIDSNDTLGGIGSGLAWAGGNTFLAVPDRGPNATTWSTAVDNTTSYTARFETLTLNLTNAPSGSLPATLTPTLTGTTLLSSPTALSYGGVTPAANTANQFFFNGRSDNFGAGTSGNPNNARIDPEGARVSNDGLTVFVSDEYGPYVYQFDRATGARLRTFTLPAIYNVANLSAQSASEISGNTSGRVANKGMEGLAITPDGTTLVGFMQSPLIQDGGDGGRANRIISIDIASGITHEYVYDNFLADKSKTYNSSELLAINSHEFLVLERDGKGKGDGTSAVVKRLYKIDLNGATDIGALNNGNGISGETILLQYAVDKTLFLDLKTALNAGGLTDTNIPAKLEGAAFGDDVTLSGTAYHTLYIANDNDFIPNTAGPSNFYAFGFTDADLGGSTLQKQSITAVPEPQSWAMIAGGAGVLVYSFRRRRLR